MTRRKSREKDLIDLMILFWNSKKTFFVFISISLIFSSIVYQFIDVKYQVSVTYKIKFLPTAVKYMCKKTDCVKNKTNDEFKALIKKKVDSINIGKNINFIVNKPNNKKDYLKILEDSNNIYTKEIYKREFFELEFLENKRDLVFRYDSKFYDIYFEAKRNIFLINKGKNVYEFGNIIIKEITNRNKILLILNIIIFISCIIFVFTREIIRERLK